MKAAIITWTTYNNFGTELQAYALQRYLQSIGIENLIISDALIIDEKNKSYTNGHFQQKKEKIIKSLYLRFKAVLKRILGINQNRILLNSQKKFQVFKNKYLNILYNPNFQCLDDEFDVYICGSDQIWSPLPVNFHPFFYASFSKKSKISYAASMGVNAIPANIKSKIAHLLSDFSAISVREKNAVDMLSEIIDNKIEWVVDPTLLFDSNFWDKFCMKRRKKTKKYLLCYFLDYKKWYISHAKCLSTYLNLELVFIPNLSQFQNGDNYFKSGVGPIEFVNLVKNSDFVLTDSYHGSIFSLIFHKQFLCLKRFDDNDSLNQNSRIYSLFEYLDLIDLIIDEKNFSVKDIKSINYSLVDKKIDYFRYRSQSFLEKSIANILSARGCDK